MQHEVSGLAAFSLTLLLKKKNKTKLSLHTAPIIAFPPAELSLDVINKHCRVSAVRVSGANAAMFFSLDIQLAPPTLPSSPHHAVDATPPLSPLYHLSQFPKAFHIMRTHVQTLFPGTSECATSWFWSHLTCLMAPPRETWVRGEKKKEKKGQKREEMMYLPGSVPACFSRPSDLASS